MKKVNLGRIALTVLNILIILLMGFMLFRAAPVVLGAGTISLDGNFDDWSGQSCISDPTGDANGPETDIAQFCFATNAGVSNAYFMLQRLSAGSGGKPLNMTLYFDTNNDGSFETQADINYKANKDSGSVSVTWPGGGDSGNWGLGTNSGGDKAEWYVPFSAMGIAPGQAIQMYLVSWQGNNVSDSSDVVQWSPANALGYVLIAILLVGGSIWFTLVHRKNDQKATIPHR
jgi:hypothetical protein